MLSAVFERLFIIFYMSTLDPTCLTWLRNHVCSSLAVADADFESCLHDESAQSHIAAFLAGQGEPSLLVTITLTAHM